MTTTDNEMLDPVRERQLLDRVAANDKAAIKELATAYDRLAVKLARSHARECGISTRDGKRDLEQQARLLLLESVRDYVKSDDVKFSTFARTRIARRLFQPTSHEVQWDDGMGEPAAKECIMAGLDDDSSHDTSRASGRMEQLLRCLDQRRRDIVVWSLGLDGLELKRWEIADRLGISAQRVSQLLSEALRDMREVAPNLIGTMRRAA